MKKQNEVKAEAKYIKISPYKLRRVADVIRGKHVLEAVTLLTHLPQRGASVIAKVLRSAVANAEHNHKKNSDDLVVSTILVNDGPRLKRFQPRARGRIYQITKRTSHIYVGLKVAKEETRGSKS